MAARSTLQAMTYPCAPTRIDRATWVSDIPITATGFAVTEVARLTIPSLADPCLLVCEMNVAADGSSSTAQVNVAMTVLAAGGNVLGAFNGNRHLAAPRTNEHPDGPKLLWSWELPPNSPGDYIIGGTRVALIGTATQAKAAASALSPGQFTAYRM